MIQEKTTHPFGLLYFIADDLHSSSEEYLLALNKLLQSPSEELADKLEVVRDALNAKVSTHIDSIAEITGNDRYTLQQVFTPLHAKGAVWFINGAALSKNVQTPEQFLRKVAEFKSFNTDAWTHSVVDRPHVDLNEGNSAESPPSPT